jgi:hypothetical protein
VQAGDPVIHEIATAPWLHDVARRTGAPAPLTLGEVPAAEWDRLTPPGVDALWLMGVWERSPVARQMALDSAPQMAALRAVLADLEAEDVLGSAYSVRRYEVDGCFGGRAGLARARAQLAARGVRLIVDYVPNHVAPDHPWVTEHPDYFVRGSADDLARDPGAFLAVGDTVVARARDPNYPPWSDVVQLDAFAPGLRRAAIATLVDIGDQADGVRCDMAMLLLDDVFARTWGDRVGGPPPTGEYWTEVLGAVRAVHPDMLFVAEVYWDLEWQLQQLGFDHCYDKRLYDRLVAPDEPGDDAGNDGNDGDAGEADDLAAAVRGHLGADLDYQRRLVRFLENHDEPRAAVVLPGDRERAAAAVVATLPGATLWHEGQFDGWRVRLPVHLGRGPDEPVDHELRRFYLGLVVAAPAITRGEWARCATSGWPPDDTSYDQLLTWCWTDTDADSGAEDAGRRSLVVVNYADARAAARVHLPWDDLAGRSWLLADPVADQTFVRDGTELAATGLYVELPPWGRHLFTWSPAPTPAIAPTPS